MAQPRDPRKLGQRVVALDGLRSIAFLAVFAHHVLRVPFLWGGNDLFFVLSGYLITGILVEQPREGFFRRFYWRRFLRIFPPYYAVLVVLFATLHRSEWQRDWAWYVFYVSNFRDALFGDVPHYLSPFWSLAVEEQFYLIWPLVISLVPQSRLEKISVGAIIAAPIFRLSVTLMGVLPRASYALLPARMDLLAVGAWIALVRKNRPERFEKVARFALPAAALAGMWFLALSALRPTFRAVNGDPVFAVLGYELMLAVVAGIVMHVVQGKRDIVTRGLEFRPAVLVGTVSYGSYLIHVPVRHALDRVAGLPEFAKAVATLVVTLAIAAASWRWFETPLLRLKDREFGAKSKLLPPDTAEHSQIPASRTK